MSFHETIMRMPSITTVHIIIKMSRVELLIYVVDYLSLFFIPLLRPFLPV